MNNLSNLTITNREFDLNTGFFWVEFENGKSLQCCLKQYGNCEDGYYYAEEVEIDNNGFDEGLSLDNNEWAFNEDGEAGHVHDFLIEQAREVGLQIVA